MTAALLAVGEVGVEAYFFIIFLAIIGLVLLSIVGKFIALWFQAFVSGTTISLFNIME